MNTTYTITTRKTGATNAIDYKALPEVSQEFVIQYGLKQILNDCHSDLKQADFETPEAFKKAVDDVVADKIANLQEGKLRVNGERLDPIAKAMLDIAIIGLKKAKGLTTKAATEAAKALDLEAVPGLREKAVKHLKAQEKLMEGLDLSNI